jgi:hypothetical protein
MKTLYYAHSIRIYDTRKEKKELRLIKKEFPDYKIINPADIKLTGSSAEIMQAYLNIVKTVDALVFSEYLEHIGKGVFLEIDMAVDKDIETQLLRKKKFNHNFRVRIIDPDDWAIRYAKIIRE